jgi:hypothetical protein
LLVRTDELDWMTDSFLAKSGFRAGMANSIEKLIGALEAALLQPLALPEP